MYETIFEGVPRAVNSVILLVIPAVGALVLACLVLLTTKVTALTKAINNAEKKRDERTAEIKAKIDRAPANRLAKRVIRAEATHNRNSPNRPKKKGVGNADSSTETSSD